MSDAVQGAWKCGKKKEPKFGSIMIDKVLKHKAQSNNWESLRVNRIAASFGLRDMGSCKLQYFEAILL
jgi:hypothetical protein